jgi:hypothetical protein
MDVNRRSGDDRPMKRWRSRVQRILLWVRAVSGSYADAGTYPSTSRTATRYDYHYLPRDYVEVGTAQGSARSSTNWTFRNVFREDLDDRRLLPANKKKCRRAKRGRLHCRRDGCASVMAAAQFATFRLSFLYAEDSLPVSLDSRTMGIVPDSHMENT